jgi:hypothetical protein
MTMVTTSLREKREQLVRDHMETENRHEFDATLATFKHPRYELIALHHSDDAVIVEFDLLGTHNGTFRGLPPTGRSFRCRMVAIFEFEGEGLVCERVYFDSATILRQLGIAHDPLTLTGRIATVVNHPVTIGRALVRRVTGR